MKITVTESDILTGSPDNANFCPIAAALARVPGVSQAYVGGTGVRFLWKHRESRFFKLPVSACRFIKKFDGFKPVKPFSFRLPI